MLSTTQIKEFRLFLESGKWADAFEHAGEELRLEMIEKIEELLDAADVADRVVGEIMFSKDGMPSGGGNEGSSAQSSELKGD